MSSLSARMSLRGSFQPQAKKTAAAPPGASSRAKGAATALTTSGKSLTAKALALTVRRAALSDAESIQRLYQEQSLLQRENIVRSYGAHRIQTLMSALQPNRQTDAL